MNLIERDDGSLAVTIADATGHGIGPALVIAECRCAVERKMGPPRTGIIDDRGWQWEHDGTMTAKEAGSAVSYLDVEGGEHADAKGVTRYAVVVPVASDASGLRVLLGGGIDPHVVGP